MDRPGGEPGDRRPVRHRQVPPGRGPGPRRDREGPVRRLVHPGDPHRRDRPGQSRRVRRPHRDPDLPQRPHRGRRHRHAPRRAGRRRGVLPHHRRRLRTQICRGDQQHPPLRLRHHHAQDPRHRHRRPAAPPRPPGPDQGRLAPARRSPHRKRGDPAGDLTPARRENTRPPAWKTGGRQPGETRPPNRISQWPLTVLGAYAQDQDRAAIVTTLLYPKGCGHACGDTRTARGVMPDVTAAAGGIIGPRSAATPTQRTFIDIQVAPYRRGFLIDRGNSEQLSSAMLGAATIWGGMRSPILPVEPDGTVAPAWLEIASAIDPAVLVDFTGQTNNTSTWLVAGENPWPVVRARPLHDASFWGVHPIAAFTPEELSNRSLYLPKGRT